jgi:2'-5' RNA ligase
MRLFVALPVTGAAALELTTLLDRFGPLGWPVKWIRPDQCHVTVKFLGEVRPEMVATIEATLREAVGSMAALTLYPDELGGFPTVERARVLWAGYQMEPALELMAHRVERACATLGFAVEGRPFRPHVTLGRLRGGQRLATEGAAAWAAETLHEAFVADRVVLYQSHLGAGGSRYSALTRFPLTAT